MSHPPEQPPIVSPCCGICRIDEMSELCTGCLRTLDEIGRWSTMDNEQKLAVLDACQERQPRCSGGGIE